MSDFINIVSFIIHKPNRFISRLRVFFNTAPILSLINEEQVEIDFPGNHFSDSKASIKGKLGGLLGFLSVRDITGVYVGVSKSKYPIDSIQPKLFNNEAVGEFNRAKGFPIRTYQISVFLRSDLPDVLVEATRSFCKSYSDVGRDWDYLF